jgi:zinc-binding in reverse transcriptase
MWLLSNNKILTRDNLIKRGWIDVDLCPMCTDMETVFHLFSKCQAARHVWFWIGQSQNPILCIGIL